MSLILEALKKSEQQRRLGEAPTLGSPVIAMRKSRNLLPLFGVLIAIALAAGWWLSRAPVADAPPGPDANTAKPSIADAARPAKPAADANAAKREVPAANPAAAHRQPPNANASTAVANPRGTPPAAAPTPAKPPFAQNPSSAAPASNPPAPVATPTPVAPVAATPAKPNATATPAPAVAPPTATDKPVTANTAAPPRAPATAPAAPAQPALPSVWDLPYSTRKDLPELPLTMHVFAADPSQRFVVIKGERHVEGDNLGDDVTLKEIRADGMVLEFKGQRFVYPRDGR